VSTAARLAGADFFVALPMLVLFLGQALTACDEPAPFAARFAVRGRWPDASTLTYRIDAAHGPLDARVFAEAIEAALGEWQATGCARFTATAADALPDVVFSWHGAAHDACVGFGADPGVAHAGPVAAGTFVHFDAGRAWEEAALRQAALHEIGHVLGLDHAADEAAVMFPEPSPARARLAGSDLAGIHSLYGGGAGARGDLVVEGGPTLHGVAPPELTGWTLFDVDGDGDDEVLVWRTDAAGHGALTSFHFDRGPVLARTVGPLHGVVLPRLEPRFVTTAGGERLVILEPEHAPAQARTFDAQGLPRPFAGELPARGARPAISDELRGDLDGDGAIEFVRR